MDVGVSNRVIARNGIGRFIAECEAAATRSVEKALDEGVKLSKGFAPVGTKHDKRTPPLHAAFYTTMLGRTSGVWGNFARHALPIEKGAVPHIIRGNPALSFYWEAAGRWWVPASEFYHQPGLADVINHPGNAAQPYLRPAYTIVMRRMMDIMKQEYPG